MKIAGLIDQVAAAANLQKPAAKKAITAVLSSIVDTAKAGEEVNLSGFGKFKLKDTPERQSLGPSGEPVTIAASRKLVFMPAREVREALGD